MRRRGTFPTTAATAIVPSRLASVEARQTWIPLPNARCSFGLRATSNLSGSGNRVGSRLAAADLLPHACACQVTARPSHRRADRVVARLYWGRAPGCYVFDGRVYIRQRLVNPHDPLLVAFAIERRGTAADVPGRIRGS